MRPLRRIDVHAHAIPPALPRLAERYLGDWPQVVPTATCSAQIRLGDKHFRDIDDRCWSVARRLADMDAESVDMQVLSPVPVTFSYALDPRGAAELSRFQNDWLADLVRSHPTRFSAFGAVPLQDGDEAAREAAYIADELGLPGVEIGTNVAGRALDDSSLDSFWAVCAEKDLTVFLHPWQVLGAERLAQHGLLYAVGMPAETAAAAVSLVVGGVLGRHPGLRVLLAHGGGALLSVLPRVDRVQQRLPGAAGVQVADYLRRFYYDSLVYDPAALQALVRRVGSDRVVVGTDYPFPIGESPAGAVVEAAELSPADVAAVLAGTAATLLRLA